MIGRKTDKADRKTAAILKILGDSAEPLNSRTISQRLRDQGIVLSEKAVRSRMNYIDRSGLSYLTCHRDEGLLTLSGLEELANTLASEKVGPVLNKIELLAYLTSFDRNTRSGYIPIDISLFSQREFAAAMNIMSEVFETDLSMSKLAVVASEGEKLGKVLVPKGMVGLVTVSNVIVNGSFLKAGIPIVSCFGGMLQVCDKEPRRFVDLIRYDGSTLDPFEIFLASRITNVLGALKHGNGKILASFYEIPMPSRSVATETLEKLGETGLCNTVIIGKPGSPICEIPVRLDNVGLLVFGGLNPVAAAAEAGVNVTCKAMSGIIDVNRLKGYRDFWERYK